MHSPREWLAVGGQRASGACRGARRYAPRRSRRICLGQPAVLSGLYKLVGMMWRADEFIHDRKVVKLSASSEASPGTRLEAAPPAYPLRAGNTYLIWRLREAINMTMHRIRCTVEDQVHRNELQPLHEPCQNPTRKASWKVAPACLDPSLPVEMFFSQDRQSSNPVPVIASSLVSTAPVCKKTFIW